MKNREVQREGRGEVSMTHDTYLVKWSNNATVIES